MTLNNLLQKYNLISLPFNVPYSWSLNPSILPCPVLGSILWTYDKTVYYIPTDLILSPDHCIMASIKSNKCFDLTQLDSRLNHLHSQLQQIILNIKQRKLQSKLYKLNKDF